jgi:hypothetical protein
MENSRFPREILRFPIKIFGKLGFPIERFGYLIFLIETFEHFGFPKIIWVFQ